MEVKNKIEELKERVRSDSHGAVHMQQLDALRCVGGSHRHAYTGHVDTHS